MEVRANEESIIRTAVDEAKAGKDAEMEAKMIKMIKEMNADGMDTTTIAKYTGFSVEEIEEILKQ